MFKEKQKIAIKNLNYETFVKTELFYRETCRNQTNLLDN